MTLVNHCLLRRIVRTNSARQTNHPASSIPTRRCRNSSAMPLAHALVAHMSNKPFVCWIWFEMVFWCEFNQPGPGSGMAVHNRVDTRPPGRCGRWDCWFRLHVACRALHFQHRMRGREVRGGSIRQHTDGAQQHIVLRRMMGRTAGVGPGRAPVVVTLGADVDVWVIFVRKHVRGRQVEIIG